MIRPDFVNHRMPGEKFSAYRARLKTVAKAIKLHLKGRLVYESSKAVVLPLRTVDLQVDEQIRQGKLRDVKMVMAPAPGLAWPHGPRVARQVPKQIRVGRTKGKSFRYDDREVVRAAALKTYRDARAAA